MKCYDLQTQILHDDQKTLPSFRTIEGIAYCNLSSTANNHTLRKCNILPDAVVDDIAEGMVANGGFTVEVVDGVAHKIFNVVTVAEYEADEEADIDKLVALYGADLFMLDMLMQQVGLSYPTDPEAVQSHIRGLISAGNTDAILIGLAVESQWKRLAPVESELLEMWEAINDGR